MLNAFASLKFSKKCWHDAQKPHWNWPISWGKYPKIDRSVKVNVVALTYYGSCRLLHGNDSCWKQIRPSQKNLPTSVCVCLVSWKQRSLEIRANFRSAFKMFWQSCLPGQCLQLFRERLSNKRGKAYVTMSKYIDLGQPKSVAPGPGCSEPN